MFDDASRTRRTDASPEPRFADYVIVTAAIAIGAIAGYRALDDGSTGQLAEAPVERASIERGVVR